MAELLPLKIYPVTLNNLTTDLTDKVNLLGADLEKLNLPPQGSKSSSFNNLNTSIIPAGRANALFWTAEPPIPLSRENTCYFGLPNLPAPFLDWAPSSIGETGAS